MCVLVGQTGTAASVSAGRCTSAHIVSIWQVRFFQLGARSPPVKLAIKATAAVLGLAYPRDRNSSEHLLPAVTSWKKLLPVSRLESLLCAIFVHNGLWTQIRQSNQSSFHSKTQRYVRRWTVAWFCENLFKLPEKIAGRCCCNTLASLS